MTTKEYLHTYETNQPRELAHGMVRERPAPFFSHQQVALTIARQLADHVDAAQLGQVGIAQLTSCSTLTARSSFSPTCCSWPLNGSRSFAIRCGDRPTLWSKSSRKARSLTTRAKSSPGTASTVCASTG